MPKISTAMPPSPTPPSRLAEPEPVAEPDQIILGIDVGSRSTGYGVLHCVAGRERCYDWGCIRPPANADTACRLSTIYRALSAVIERVAPSVMAVEGVFVSRNPATAITLGQTRGVVLLAAAEAGLTVAEYAPAMVKKAVTSSGRADKGQVQYMVCQLLRLSSVPPEDAADALAVALCHSYRNPVAVRRVAL